MEPPDQPLSPDDRNRLILHRTLSAVSWLCGLVNGLLGITAWGFRQPMGPWVTVHAILLGLAGFGLWKPRRWGWAAALLASAASVVFVVLDRNWEAAAFDGVYPVVTLVILGMTGRRRSTVFR